MAEAAYAAALSAAERNGKKEFKKEFKKWKKALDRFRIILYNQYSSAGTPQR